MNINEIYITIILNIILSFRMIGIFIILPVLSTYGLKLYGATESLIGIAIGIYGLTQIIFQIPFGLASDKIGRKPVIIGGLLISAIGTSIATITNTMWGVIIGRALQGISAISGVIIALLSDLITKKHKTQAIMFIGLNFSITFAISIILGPIITNIIGLRGLFGIITLLTLLNIILMLFFIPSPNKYSQNNHTYQITANHKITKILTQPQLIKINCSIFFLHTILILNFIALPQIMHLTQLLPFDQSKIYFINILIALTISAIAILNSEKTHSMKNLLTIAIYILLISETILLYKNNNLISLYISTLLFFVAFNIIEGILPSILIKEITITHKGLISGIFSTSQFLGTTCGGILGGYLLNIHNIQTIFYSEIIITIIWIIIINSLKEPPYIN